MAVTVAVETVISDHYNDQLRELHAEGLTEGDFEELRKVLMKPNSAYYSNAFFYSILKSLEMMKWSTMTSVYSTKPRR